MPGTAFEILSIDIADVDVGKNIGAELADRPGRSGQAGSLKRRPRSGARWRSRWSRNTRPKRREQRAGVIAAEAQIPLAMADAFRNGKLWRDGLSALPEPAG